MSEKTCPFCGEAMITTSDKIIFCENADCATMLNEWDFPKVAAAMELARAVVKANEPYCLSTSPIAPDYDTVVFGRFVSTEMNEAEKRVLEVFGGE